MRHKTIENLIQKVERSVEIQRRAQPIMKLLGIEPTIRAIVHYRAEGRPVWSVEYDTCCWYLYHYGVLLLSYDEQTGEVTERVGQVSVSDQHGMNGFLNALDINYYVRRAGRTARYA